MTYRTASVGINKNKDKKLYRESSKKNYENEKREIQSEFHNNQIELEKLFNESYEYYGEHTTHGLRYVVFKENGTDHYREIEFNFEENYLRLKSLWSPLD